MRARFRRSGATTADDDSSDQWEAVTERARQDMEARRRALEPMVGIVRRISAALLEHDPVGLGGKDDDEYDSEAETIVMRLSDRRTLPTALDVSGIVHEEFLRWFGEDLAGAAERYGDVAVEIHRLWDEFLAGE